MQNNFSNSLTIFLKNTIIEINEVGEEGACGFGRWISGASERPSRGGLILLLSMLKRKLSNSFLGRLVP